MNESVRNGSADPLETTTLQESIEKERRSLAHRILKIFSGKTIIIHNRLYLTRYYLLGNGDGRHMEVYLHHMHDVDRFRWLHNHPWRWFLSIILVGSYKQKLFDSERNTEDFQHLRWFNFFRGVHRYHSINELPRGHAWTLVFVPKKSKAKDWGYWDSDQKKHVADDIIGHESARIEMFGRKTLID